MKGNRKISKERANKSKEACLRARALFNFWIFVFRLFYRNRYEYSVGAMLISCHHTISA